MSKKKSGKQWQAKPRKKKTTKGTASRTTKAARRGEYIEQNVGEPKIERKTGKEIAVIAISVIVAVSMLLPSLAMITGQNATNDSSVGESAQEIVTQYADNYTAAKEAADADPDNLELQKNLGDMAYQYASWLPYESMFSSSEDMSEEEQAAKAEEDAAKAEEMYQIAYDSLSKWLDGQEDQNSTDALNVRTSIGEILYAQQKSDEAIAIFEKLTEENQWPNAYLGLGQIYEQQGDTDKAIEYYNQAIEADADDTYGAKTTAQSRIDSINEAAKNAESGEDTTTTTEDGVEVSGDGVEVTTESGSNESSE